VPAFFQVFLYPSFYYTSPKHSLAIHSEQRGFASLSRRDIVPAGKTSLIVNATL